MNFLYTSTIIKTGDNEEKVVLKELQKDPAKGKLFMLIFKEYQEKQN